VIVSPSPDGGAVTAAALPAGDGELRAWLRLLLTPGVGRDTARRLLAAFGSGQAIFRAGIDARSAVVKPDLARALAAEPPELEVAWANTQRWLQDGPARHIVTLADAAYPPLLLNTADPPLLLFAQGRLGLLNAAGVAIVGSRQPTPAGRENAHRIARQLSAQGVTVVSGLAAGVDGAAHEGALAGPGSTIAVVGTGLDEVYPPRHAALARGIAEHGLLLSEFPLGTPPLAQHFPMRNRIIAGLTRATLVVEAALRSGSLITARLAAEAGREVFALPGSVNSAQSRGCHALIKQGATLVEGAEDILAELQALPALRQPPVEAGSALAPDDLADSPLLQALGHDPATLDALLARTGLPVSQLNAQLLELELAGAVARLPGGLFQRCGSG
jgi:DNA processing protein